MTPDFLPLKISVLVVSDTRTLDTDESGALIEGMVQAAGHEVVERRVVTDDKGLIAAAVADESSGNGVNVIILTGGTGVTRRDVTPEAVAPLLDKELPGFGEIFRWLSWEEIGASTIQSRALAGVRSGTLIFCLPGSKGACVLGMEQLILPQLDHRTTPCSFGGLMGKL